jgi:general secretion pathway protein A
MYKEYFGFREKPFNITPDPRFFYANSSYEEAYANLFYGIRERKGFIVLTGEVGTGKTTLLRKLMDNLERTARFVLFYNTTLSFEELLDFSFMELGLEAPQGGRLQKIQVLNQFLISELAHGGLVALLIDEAQNLSDEVLENLRLLSNLETAREKLLQIVLVGQPELDTKLSQPHLRQLKQRITTRCHLARLRDSEIGAFIAHRLRTAGYEGPDLFSPEALQRLIVHCQGIPRLVNVICDSVLLLAYGSSQKIITPAMIDEVARDLQLQTQVLRRPVIIDSNPDTTFNSKTFYSPEKAQSAAKETSQSRSPENPSLQSVRPLERTAEEPKTFRSPYIGQRLAWIGAFALIVFCGFIALDKPIDKTESASNVQQEFKSSKSVSQEIANHIRFLNERLSVLLTPVLSVVQKQPGPSETSRVALAQESTLPPKQQDQNAIAVMAANTTSLTDSGNVKDNQQEKLLERPVSFASAPSSGQRDTEEFPPSAQENGLTTQPLATNLSSQRNQSAPPSDETTDSLVLQSPESLRQGSLRPGETISMAVRNIYGSYNSLALDLIKEFNPQLVNLDQVAVGQKIWFPPLTLETLLKRQHDGTYRLIVATFRTAARAERFAQTLRERGHRVQITAQQVSESILLHRVEIIDLSSPVEVHYAWKAVNPTNIFFAAPKTPRDTDSTETRPPQNEAVDFPETGL